MRILLNLLLRHRARIPADHLDDVARIINPLFEPSPAAAADGARPCRHSPGAPLPDVPYTFTGIRAPRYLRRLENTTGRPELCLEPGAMELVIGSPIETELRRGASRLLFVGNSIRIAGAEFDITQAHGVPCPALTHESRLTCLTPILAAAPTRDGNVECFGVDQEREFSEVVRRDLLVKFTWLHGSPPGRDDLMLRFDRDYIWRKQKSGMRTVSCDGHNYPAVFAPFVATGSPELMAVGWECGFGTSNCAGFGVVDLVRYKPHAGLRHDRRPDGVSTNQKPPAAEM